MGSGFEKFVSGLAIRIALTSISNIPHPNFMVIDEGWGTMDAENLSKVQTLLSFLKSKFDFIIVISHLDALRDMVDHQMEIKIDDEFSHISYI
jgi:exonuclease SbcC